MRRSGWRRTSAPPSGPPLGGLFLLGGSWNHLWLGASVLGSIAAVIAYRFIPVRGAYAPSGAPERGSFAVVVRDRVFLLFMLSAAFATMTYVAFETLLPISATTTHHLPPSAWGLLVVLNPILVTLFQMRVIRWTAEIPASVKLLVAMPLMGVPFLLLNANGSAGTIAAVVLLFVCGEMLWVPTSQAVVAALAPADIRGAYMGAFGGTWSVGWALTPFLGLEVRGAYGDGTMWACVAAVSLVAGLTGLVAARGHDAQATSLASPA